MMRENMGKMDGVALGKFMKKGLSCPGVERSRTDARSVLQNLTAA
jgi:hypothetical protein